MVTKKFESRVNGLVKLRKNKRGISLYSGIVTPDPKVIQAVEDAATETGRPASELLARFIERALRAGVPMVK